MSTQFERVEAHHNLQYRDNVMMVAQQAKSLIRPNLTVVPASGEATSASDLVGTVRAKRGQGDDLRNINNPGENTRRWLVQPDPVETGLYILKRDTMSSAINPTSKYVSQQTMAVIRGVDEVGLGVYYDEGENRYREGTGGVFGAAVTGKRPNGSPAGTIPASCVTPAEGVGLTLDKLKGARKRLQKDDFGIYDDLPLIGVIGPDQVEDLLTFAITEGESLNLFQQEQLKTGKPTGLLGITWVVTNMLPLNDAGERRCVLYDKSNIVMGVWEDVMGQAWNDTNAKNTPYFYVSAYVDCVRVQDKAVQIIECVEG